MELLLINWSNTFIIVGLGLSIVFVILTLLVFILNYLHRIVNKTEAVKPAKSVGQQKGGEHFAAIAAALHLDAATNKEHIAAIAAALHLCCDEEHDAESGILTIKPRKTAWNSKIFSINRFKV